MKTDLPINQRIGITECGDPGFDFSWEENLGKVAFGVLITKQLHNTLIDKCLKHINKLIIHVTCTGMGETVIEPNVPKPEITMSQIYRLIEKGFPAEQIVLRLDPVVPTNKGILTAEKVMILLCKLNDKLEHKGLGEIKRVRYSFLDMYKHVEARFEEKNIPLPYGKGVFTASATRQSDFIEYMAQYSDIFEFESCAEGNMHSLGCVSSKDINIMRKYGHTVNLIGSAKQRKGCLCPQNKVQLIDFKTPFNCKSGCLYCYWR